MRMLNITEPTVEKTNRSEMYKRKIMFEMEAGKKITEKARNEHSFQNAQNKRKLSFTFDRGREKNKDTSVSFSRLVYL